ncbi:hypothetical protein EJ04DRAFT_514969 [Polyplosphaeria fusca]|uniref:Uncharacterized protein n=1 Tax=Polyplosphaeria fusca TaxID=682080 RepID=A0A9P4QTV3_9PLEO|nr:hypothetical protein EJ04DRAFT_514969 [Polyplosphaeria fusca]
MSLSRQSLSPGANLLRNSRLFSLPNPLPRPSVAETSGVGIVRVSESATLPYPTHQAIATTHASLARGDWGLKRPLPARSHVLQTSNPVVKIKQLDTIEQVTDFDSAADHVRTREKWAEMNVPIMRGRHDQSSVVAGSQKSAFEPVADISAYDSDEALDEAGRYLKALAKAAAQRGENQASFEPIPRSTAPVVPTRRWKHEGPWLPGMSADEFTSYLTDQLSARRTEFNQYLTEFVKNEMYNGRRAAEAQSGSVPLDAAEAELYLTKKEVEWSTFTPGDVERGIRALRAECATDPLNSRLVKRLIVPFLRLAPMVMKNVQYSSDPNVGKYKFDEDHAPASTHPSAGLGYLRSKAYLTNHPILGPQEKSTPIQARVIQARKTNKVVMGHAKLGVGGFVADDDYSGVSNAPGRMLDVDMIDIDTEGGAKKWVEPLNASISPDGRVLLKVARRAGAEVSVARGWLEDRPPVREATKMDNGNDLLKTLAAVGKGTPTATKTANEFKVRRVMSAIEQIEQANREAEQAATRDAEKKQ